MGESKVQKGSEIADKIQDTFWKNDVYSLRDVIHTFLDGKVVVPEEKWEVLKQHLAIPEEWRNCKSPATSETWSAWFEELERMIKE